MFEWFAHLDSNQDAGAFCQLTLCANQKLAKVALYQHITLYLRLRGVTSTKASITLSS
jgi:hypothetical protein